MPLPVLQCVCDYFMTAPLAAGAFALDTQAEDIMALALVQRCDRRSGMLHAAWRARASAQRCRAACWQRNHALDSRQLRRLLRTVPELDPEEALHRQVRRLIYTGRVTHELLQRAMDRDPGLMPWIQQQRAAVAFELAQASQAARAARAEDSSAGESDGDSESAGESDGDSESAGEPADDVEG